MLKFVRDSDFNDCCLICSMLHVQIFFWTRLDKLDSGWFFSFLIVMVMIYVLWKLEAKWPKPVELVWILICIWLFSCSKCLVDYDVHLWLNKAELLIHLWFSVMFFQSYKGPLRMIEVTRKLMVLQYITVAVINFFQKVRIYPFDQTSNLFILRKFAI